jgi:hypothetical protein
MKWNELSPAFFIRVKRIGEECNELGLPNQCEALKKVYSSEPVKKKDSVMLL